MISRAALRSELLNLRATGTARALLIGSVVMAVASLTANLATFDVAELSGTAAIQQAMHASTVATITFALIAGLVNATSDYRFGRMDQLLLSQPKPSAVLLAKTFAGFLLGIAYGIGGSVAALAGVSLYYRLNDVPIDLTSAVVVRPLIGVMVASGMFVAIGIGVGTAVRNQPAAVAGGLSALLIVQPPLLLGLPDVGRWLPGAAGLAMTLAPDPAMLEQITGSLVLFGWMVLALAVGDQRLKALGG